MASIDWATTTAGGDEKDLGFWIWCDLYQRFDGAYYLCLSVCLYLWIRFYSRQILRTHIFHKRYLGPFWMHKSMTWNMMSKSDLKHPGRVTPICSNKLGNHGFRYWLIACLVPSHYQNQCWYVLNWTTVNKFRSNLNRNTIIFIKGNAFNSLRAINGSIRHQHKTCFVQIMACRLFGAKPLSEPMLYYCLRNKLQSNCIRN